MILGIDIGGTTTKLGLVAEGALVAQERIPTTGHADAQAFAEALARTAEALTKAARGEHPLAAGIGAPNGNHRTGCIEQAPNLPWKEDVPLAAMLQQRLGLPCTLGNDANAAAVGEWRYGAGQGCTDLLVVTLGTGLGSGLIVGGELLLGPYGNAGELGHMILLPDGRPCTCGRNGCLEAYVSIRGIRTTYAEHASDTLLLRDEGVRPIAEAADQGDQAARATFEATARWLAIGLANAVALVPPQRIVLCGGIAQSGGVLLRPLRKHFAEQVLSIHRGRWEPGVSALKPDEAGVLGAAALATLSR